MPAVRVRLTVDRHGLDAELPAGVHDPARDFSPVRDYYFIDASHCHCSGGYEQVGGAQSAVEASANHYKSLVMGLNDEGVR